MLKETDRAAKIRALVARSSHYQAEDRILQIRERRAVAFSVQMQWGGVPVDIAYSSVNDSDLFYTAEDMIEMRRR